MATAEVYPTGPIDNLIKQMYRLQQFSDTHTDRYETLTKREIEVLTLIADGLKNPAISKELGITRTTVQNHRASLRDKLGISTPTEYIKYAMAFDLIQF